MNNGYDVMLNDVIPDDIMLNDVIPDDVMLNDVITDDVMLNDVIPDDVMLNDVLTSFGRHDFPRVNNSLCLPPYHLTFV